MSDLKIFLIIFGFIAIMFLFVGAIVFFTISRAINKNKEYEIFAKNHNYGFDKAQGSNNYAMSGNYYKKSSLILTEGKANEFVKKYANYKTYPFGLGANKRVCYVIEGKYLECNFRAFTYVFEGNILNSGKAKKGGIFSIVVVKLDDGKQIINLPDNVFIEENIICEYLPSNLDINTLHSRIENLRNLIKKPV